MNPAPKSGKYGILKLLPLGTVLGLLLALGLWNGGQRAAGLDAEMREALLRKTVELANLVNPWLAQKLTFTKEDKGTAAYELICEQLTHASKTLTHRGVYSMAMRDGKLFFGPENYPPQDPMASLPGTEYQRPSAGDFEAFREKHPVTIGPVSDEYGTFVSALAPVLDPQTGKMLMAVGVDILAGDWSSRLEDARRGPLLMVIVLMLLILGGAGLIRWRDLHQKINSIRLKSWVIIPVVLAMLGGALIYGAYEYQEFREESWQEMNHLTEHVRGDWNQNMAAQARLLKAKLDQVNHDPALMKAWKDRDLGSLAGLVQPIFEELKREYGISHCYFIDADRTCFFRAHQPDRRGDSLDRYTLRTAERSGEDVWGVELGPLSTFTLRYVRPVKEGGKITGYLELGTEVERLFQNAAKDSNLETLTALRKEYTSREKFEAGQKTFQFSGAWETYPDFVVTHRTLTAFPAEVDQWLRKKSLQTGVEIFSAKLGKKRFVCGVIPLFDAEGRDVARLLLMRDVTFAIALRESTLLFSLSLFLVLLGGVLALLWSVVGSAERQLDAAFTQVRDSAESYRRQFAENSAAMLLCDPVDGRIVDANGAASRFYGYPREKLLALSITEINILPAAEVLSAMKSVSSEHGRQFEFRHRLADGSVRDVAVSASLIQLGERQVIHSIIHDITDRKRGEQELAENQRATMNILEDLTQAKEEIDAKSRELQRSEAFLKNTGQMARVGGWELDLATKALSWTDETYRIHELEIGSKLTLDAAIHCYAPESLPLLQAALQKAMEIGEPFDLELEIISVKSQKRIWVRAGGRAICEDGKIVKLRGTFQDIDARKRIEIALREKTLQLETQTWGLQKANDGIKALYQELEKKNVDLAKLDKLKDDFISIVAHELRNPLGVVREAATLMLDGLAGPVTPGLKVYIEMVELTSQRLIGITSDLLDLAKIESGKVTLHFETIDLLSLIRQSYEGIALRAHKKGLTVSEVFPGEKLLIEGDPDKLSQVMINLLSNAYKFTEKGGITVEVWDLGDEVQCIVKDTGAGMSPEDLSKLFSKFEQFGKPTTSAEKGSGLGLIISKSIVEAHGGNIRAESNLGKGSSFIVTLPKKQKQKQKIGEILLSEKMVTSEQLAEALKKQNQQKS